VDPQYLKENHPHVGSDGMVYLPYTHEWDPRTHSLIEMVVAMSSVFSADPPVFTRAAPVSPPPAPPPPAYSSYVSSSNASSRTSNDRNGASSSTTSPDSERHMREQLAAIMAKEADEANRVAEIARNAEREEKERDEKITAQKEWEKRKEEQTRIEVNKNIRSYLQDFSEEIKSTLVSDWRDQEHLKQNKKFLDKEMNDLTQKNVELKEHIETLDAKTEEIENWLKESESAKEEQTSVDDICQPLTKLDAQMLDLSAESAALTDTMYFLDRGMYMGQIDCTAHLKMIRKLAKRQFLIKAHLIKINQVIANNKR
jgi:ESCRT-I complex subunit TSG101